MLWFGGCVVGGSKPAKVSRSSSSSESWWTLRPPLLPRRLHLCFISCALQTPWIRFLELCSSWHWAGLINPARSTLLKALTEARQGQWESKASADGPKAKPCSYHNHNFH